MGASLRRENLDASLGMSRLPLSRFESRAVGVAVSGRERAELGAVMAWEWLWGQQGLGRTGGSAV
jgi:hypothetical protein